MTRPLEQATKDGFDKPIIPLAVIIYLDILDDPLFAWSGIGDLTFAAAQTGDPSLDGRTFKGTGNLIELSAVSEGVGGSDTLQVILPGVDVTEPILRQLITTRRRWQFRRAIVWLMLLDPDTNAITGKPFRIKTGRMDQMPFSENAKGGSVKCKIEGQQSYGNTPTASRYSEQIDINPNDISQRFVHSLANMTAQIGTASANAGTANVGNITAMAIGKLFNNQDYMQ